MFIFLNAKYFEFNSTKYEYRIITAYDIVCDKKFKMKNYICCGRRFFKFEDMVNFVKTGKYASKPPYLDKLTEKCGLKRLIIQKEFKKALKENNFKLAKKIYEKSSIKETLKDIALKMNIDSCELKFLNPNLVEVANAKRYKFLECFLKDKKKFAKKYWKYLDKDFFEHYNIKLFDIFSKKEINRFDEFTLENLDRKFNNNYLKGRLCLYYLYWRHLNDLKEHLNYCNYLPKNSLYYKVIFEREKAKKELEKVKFNEKNYNLGAILINLYLIDNQQQKAKRVYNKMFSSCYTFFNAVQSKIIVFILGPFFGVNPFDYSLKESCISWIDNEIYMQYEWISIFYDYSLIYPK